MPRLAQILEFTNICLIGTPPAVTEGLKFLSGSIPINFVSTSLTEMKFSGIENLPRKTILQADSLFVISTSSFEEYISEKKFLDFLGIPSCHLRNILDINVDSPIVKISEVADEKYVDNNGNQIFVDSDCILSDMAFITLGLGVGKKGVARSATVNIHKGVKLEAGFNATLIGDHPILEIGPGNRFAGETRIYLSENSVFKTGKRNSYHSLTAVSDCGGQISIGNDCMFSYEIELRQSDSHPIFDMHTKQRINNRGPIFIGDHVWMGAYTRLLGGANIGHGSIVGMNTVTSSSFQNNVAIAGNPAKLIKSGIAWAKDELRLNNPKNINECIKTLGLESFIQD